MQSKCTAGLEPKSSNPCSCPHFVELASLYMVDETDTSLAMILGTVEKSENPCSVEWSSYPCSEIWQKFFTLITSGWASRGGWDRCVCWPTLQGLWRTAITAVLAHVYVQRVLSNGAHVAGADMDFFTLHASLYIGRLKTWNYSVPSLCSLECGIQIAAHSSEIFQCWFGVWTFYGGCSSVIGRCWWSWGFTLLCRQDRGRNCQWRGYGEPASMQGGEHRRRGIECTYGLTECNLVRIEVVHLSHLWYGYPHGEVGRPSSLTNILSVECIIGSRLKNTTLTLTTFGFRF
jgi:hypothetical protein